MCNSETKSFFLILTILCLCAYGVFSYFSDNNAPQEENIYHYWNELVAQNPKPENVSQEEFIAKNKAGYCWRDRKYYSEKELKEKAMVHFSETFLYYNRLAKEERLLRDGGKIAGESAFYCQKSDTGCRLWFAPTDKTNQDFKNVLLNDYRDSPLYMSYLQKVNAREIPISETLGEYMALYDNYAIFYNGFELDMILGADCCTVIKEKNVKTIPKKRLISGEDNFSGQGKIPPDIQDITDYGVGIYYLSADYFSYNIAQENYYAEREQDKYKADFWDINHFHPISNCGDILFKPFYTIY